MISNNYWAVIWNIHNIEIWFDSIWIYFTIWKNNTSPEARILSPFVTPLNPSTLREASLFAHFWVCPKSKIILTLLPNRHKYHVFFRGRVKKIKKHNIGIQMATKWIIFWRPNFIFIFQEIHQTSPITRFCRAKNASKNDENYAFWIALMTIHTPRSGFQMGAQNHAKWR